MREKPYQETDQCATPSSGTEFLDKKIQTEKESIGYIETQLKSLIKDLEMHKEMLHELERVRKLVSPKMEAALMALRSIRILL